MRKRFGVIEILVILAAILFALPVILIFVTGFKPDAEIVHFHGLLPRQWTTENFREIFASPEEIPIARWLFNSVFISSMVALLVLAVDSLAAYALARLALPGKRWVFAIIIATLMVPGQVLLVPVYLILSKLH